VAMDSAGWVTRLRLLPSLNFLYEFTLLPIFFRLILSILQHRKVEIKGSLGSASIFVLLRLWKDLRLLTLRHVFIFFFLM
jgi:hypothetical protein